MERDDQMCNPQRLDNLDDDSPTYCVSRDVLAMWVVRLDVEVGEIARLGGQGRLQSRQKRSAGRWGVRGDGVALRAGSHATCNAHMLRLPAIRCRRAQAAHNPVDAKLRMRRRVRSDTVRAGPAVQSRACGSLVVSRLGRSSGAQTGGRGLRSSRT